MSDSFQTLIAAEIFVGLGNFPWDIFSQIVDLANVVFFETSEIRSNL
jgi:hypothetical protein